MTSTLPSTGTIASGAAATRTLPTNAPTPSATTAPGTLPKPATAAAPPLDEKTWKAATDFEAMTINELIEPMFETVDTSKDEFGGGVGEASFKPMLVNEMALEMERAGGIGLSQAIYKQMLAMQEKEKKR